MTAPIYKGEALVKRWGDSSNALRTVTLQLEEEEQLGRHPFYGHEGARVMIVVMPIGNDQQPVKVEPTGRQLGGIARAESLSPERRSEIAKAAADQRWAKPKQKWSEMRPSAQAALRCKDADFQSYVAAKTGCTSSEEEAAAYVRSECDITSRAELDEPLTWANERWNGIDYAFQSWQGDQRAVEQARGHGVIA